jgi:hypothetical protein
VYESSYWQGKLHPWRLTLGALQTQHYHRSLPLYFRSQYELLSSMLSVEIQNELTNARFTRHWSSWFVAVLSSPVFHVC